MDQSDYYKEKLSVFTTDKQITHQSEMNVLIEKEEMNLFSMLRPSLSVDGNQWCCLYGEDLHDGIAGFGDTPMKAIYAWNKEWHKSINAIQKLNNNG